MTANPHLIPILDHWLTLKKPGFAIMVTAPWGAGKSFAVKDWLKGKQYVYVSLFGLDSAKAIEEALFQAALERDSGNTSGKSAQLLSKAADKFAQLAGGAIEKATNVTVDLSGLYRASVLSFLPELIIFDDLERAQMPASQLLSVLNRYVEHQGKSVLLIANEAELDSTPAPPKGEDTDPKAPKSDYRRWREKVVGRTITLAPETDAALTAFLEALPEGKGKTLLTAQRPLIRDVFDLSKTHNLRLLRQSLTDLCHFLDRLPETYRTQTKVLPGLMGDFLALSIAWHAGDRLEEADFDFRARDIQAASRSVSGKVPTQNGFLAIRTLYKGNAKVNLDGSVLPGKLAFFQIVRGHADWAETADLMRQASAFQQVVPHSWRRLYVWRQLPEVEAQAAFATLNADIGSKVFTEPTIILHVFALLIDLAHHGLFDLESASIVEKAGVYVTDLVGTSRLQAYDDDNPGSDWMTHDNSEGYGYAARHTEEVKAVRVILRDAMKQLEYSLRPKRLAQLLDELEQDPDRYQRAFWGGERLLDIPDMSRLLVFHGSDAVQIAEHVFSMPPNLWRVFLSPFKDRIERQEFLAAHHTDNRPTERDWLIAFREAALALSTTCTPLKRAQMHSALTGHLSFLDTPSSPNP